MSVFSIVLAVTNSLIVTIEFRLNRSQSVTIVVQIKGEFKSDELGHAEVLF